MKKHILLFHLLSLTTTSLKPMLRFPSMDPAFEDTPSRESDASSTTTSKINRIFVSDSLSTTSRVDLVAQHWSNQIQAELAELDSLFLRSLSPHEIAPPTLPSNPIYPQHQPEPVTLRETTTAPSAEQQRPTTPSSKDQKSGIANRLFACCCTDTSSR